MAEMVTNRMMHAMKKMLQGKGATKVQMRETQQKAEVGRGNNYQPDTNQQEQKINPDTMEEEQSATDSTQQMLSALSDIENNQCNKHQLHDPPHDNLQDHYKKKIISTTDTEKTPPCTQIRTSNKQDVNGLLSEEIMYQESLALFDFQHPLQPKEKGIWRIFYNNCNGIEINSAMTAYIIQKKEKNSTI